MFLQAILHLSFAQKQIVFGAKLGGISRRGGLCSIRRTISPHQSLRGSLSRVSGLYNPGKRVSRLHDVAWTLSPDAQTLVRVAERLLFRHFENPFEDKCLVTSGSNTGMAGVSMAIVPGERQW